MGNLWLKIKIWTKIGIASLLLIYLLVFVAANSNRDVKFWYWIGRNADTSVLLLALYAFFGGIVVWILVSTTFKTVRQVREMRGKGRMSRVERELAEMRAKAAMLRPKSAQPAAPPTDPSTSGNT